MGILLRQTNRSADLSTELHHACGCLLHPLVRSGLAMRVLAAVWPILLIFLAPLHAAAAELTIAVSSTPLSMPFYIADKQGYFAAEGLQVTFKDCNGGKACLSRMMTKQADLATAAELPIMFSSFMRKDFAILATFASTNRDVKMITRKSAGIKTAKDLAGKRIGVVRGASGEYFVDLVLLTYGVDPRSVKIVDLQNADAMEKAGNDHTIDAFAAFEPGAFRIMKDMKEDGFMLPVPSISTLNFNLVGLKSTIAEKKADIPKLLRALDKAIQFIDANPEKAQTVLIQRLKVDSSFVNWAWSEYRFDLVLNQSLLTTLESQAHWAMRENLVHEKVLPNYLDLIEPAYLVKVRPTSVTLVK